MSSFKHYRDNNHRYNIYENYRDLHIRPKSYYERLRDTLLLIALVLSFSVTSLISYDTYQQKSQGSTAVKKLDPREEHLKRDIDFQKAVSDAVLHQLKAQHSFETLTQDDLTRIIENVMEKINHTPNKIIYTSSKD